MNNWQNQNNAVKLITDFDELLTESKQCIAF